MGMSILRLAQSHWEIKGRFRKRVVLANVPSFRFSFRGNIRRNHPFGKHPFANYRQRTQPYQKYYGDRKNSELLRRSVFTIGGLKITSNSTERQKRSQNLAPVLVIISGNSLVFFSRKPITSTGFYRCCALSASAVVKNQYPILRPPYLLRHGPFFERKFCVCNFQENGVRTRRAATVNHPAIVETLRVVNLLRVVFLVRRGPFGGIACKVHSWVVGP